MNLLTGRQELFEYSKQLKIEWNRLHESWSDSKADEFHKQYLQDLDRYLKLSISAIDDLDDIFRQAKEECFK